MTQAEAFARRVQRLVRNRQGTEAQVWLEVGFLYLRADGHARFAQGEGADLLQGFLLLPNGVELTFPDGSRLQLRHRLGRLEKRWEAGYFS